MRANGARASPRAAPTHPRHKKHRAPSIRAIRASAIGPSAKSTIDALNEKFAIPGSVTFENGRGDLPTALLTHKNGSTSRVYLFGATVTSWTQPSGDEVLYVRPDAAFDKTTCARMGAVACASY